MPYFTYPPVTASGAAVPVYPSEGNFPPPAVAGDGGLAIAADTDTLYISDGTNWYKIASPTTVMFIGAFDSGSPSPDAAHIFDNSLILQSATPLNPGDVNTGIQTFGGAKTFNDMMTAGTDIILSNAAYDNTLIGQSLAHNASTGILSGGNLTINGGDNTKFDIAAGTGRIINYTVPSAITINNLSWSAFTAQTTLGLTTADYTYVMIDSAGAVFQLNTYPTPQQRRENIFVGRLSHANRTFLTFANAFPDYAQSVSAQLYDLFDALGPFNIAGNLLSPNGATLNFQVSAGQIFFRAFNYPSNSYNPNVISQTSHVPLTFSTAVQSGSFIATTSTVDVTHYDVAGVVTLIPNPPATATIQRLFVLPTGNYVLQYGQATYPNLAEAKAAIGVDPFIINPALTNTGVLIGYIIAQKNATALNNPAQAVVINAPRFSVNGGGGVNQVISLQQTYNSSVTPQIVLDSTHGPLQITDNAIPLGTSLFSVSDSTVATKYLDVAATGVIARPTISSPQLISTIATGTPPLVVASTTQVANLNVATSGNFLNALVGDVTGTQGATVLSATTNSTLTSLPALTSAVSLSTVGTITTGTWNGTKIDVPHGGTNLVSGTSGGILGFTGATTIASSALLTASQLIIGGGAGFTPSTLTAGAQFQVLVMGASNPGYGQVNLAQSAAVTGILGNANGGLGTSYQAPTIQKFFNPIYNFTIASASAPAGTTYTNNGQVFQLVSTIFSTTIAPLYSLTGGAPSASGTLTGISGGSGSLTFSANVLASGATSGTYTTPAGVKWLQVKLVGGGGGGCGGGSAAGTAPGNGGVTSFGSSMLVANGGLGTPWNTQIAPGATATFTFPAIGFTILGSCAGSGSVATATAGATIAGSAGGMSPFGGGAGGGGVGSTAIAAAANSGSGGGGGVSGNGSNPLSGAGGGSGAFVDVIVPAPGASYSYAIGAGGTFGGPGTGGSPGLPGASGCIIVIEHYV